MLRIQVFWLVYASLVLFHVSVQESLQMPTTECTLLVSRRIILTDALFVAHGSSSWLPSSSFFGGKFILFPILFIDLCGVKNTKTVGKSEGGGGGEGREEEPCQTETAESEHFFACK